MTFTSKRLGIIGGLSRSSTIRHHQIINHDVQKLTQYRCSADLVTWSLDPGTLTQLLSTEDWRSSAYLIQEAARILLLEGAEGLMITSDTLHCVLDHEAITFPVPLIHIRDALADEIRRLSLKKIGFLGSSTTMTGSYHRDLIQGSTGVEIVLPSQNLWVNIDYSISNQIFSGGSEALEIETYNRVLSEFADQNVDGIVVASSEIDLAYNGANPIPVLNTVKLQAAAAARWCVAGRDIVRPGIPLFDEARLAPAYASTEMSDDPSKISFTIPYQGRARRKRKGKADAASAAAVSASAGQQPSRR